MTFWLFWISQGKVATVHRWGGQLYKLLKRPVVHLIRSIDKLKLQTVFARCSSSKQLHASVFRAKYEISVCITNKLTTHTPAKSIHEHVSETWNTGVLQWRLRALVGEYQWYVHHDKYLGAKEVSSVTIHLQTLDVKFSQDLTHQKSLKLVNVWELFEK